MKSNRSPRAVLASTLVAAFAPGAFGAPIPITACGDITARGSYVLANNLSSSGDCIRVQADFVTLDLDGHVIMGNGTGSGISNKGDTPGLVGITVRNGIVNNFEQGIDFSARSVVMIERMNVISHVELGIGVGSAIVRDSVVSRAPNYAGILVEGHGLVARNAITENLNGVVVKSPGSTVAGNVVAWSSATTAHGILAVESSVTRNTVLNSGRGISVFCPSLVMGNTSWNTYSASPNLWLSGTTCTVDHNSAP